MSYRHAVNFKSIKWLEKSYSISKSSRTIGGVSVLLGSSLLPVSNLLPPLLLIPSCRPLALGQALGLLQLTMEACVSPNMHPIHSIHRIECLRAEVILHPWSVHCETHLPQSVVFEFWTPGPQRVVVALICILGQVLLSPVQQLWGSEALIDRLQVFVEAFEVQEMMNQWFMVKHIVPCLDRQGRTGAEEKHRYCSSGGCWQRPLSSWRAQYRCSRRLERSNGRGPWSCLALELQPSSHQYLDLPRWIR